MSDAPVAPPLPRTSRRKRPVSVVIAELRALAGIAIERALDQDGALAQPELITWARSLAAEIDLDDALGAIATWDDLVQALARVHAAVPDEVTAEKTTPRARQRMRRAR